MAGIPKSIDRMPAREDRLDPDQVIAASLNSITHEWWKRLPVSETSEPVRAVRNGLRLAGYKIVPMEREDFK